MESKRSRGITIFGWTFVTIGVVLFLLTLAGYIRQKDIVYRAFRANLPWFIAGICYLTIGIGILKLRHWARYLLFWLGGLSLLLQPVLVSGAIWGGLIFFRIFLSISILYIIFLIASFVFFSRPGIKEQFS